MSGPTKPWLNELVRDLKPVHRIPSLRTIGAGVVAVWLASIAVEWAVGGIAPEFGPVALGGDPGFLVVLAGLGIAAVGVTLGALASAVPGREDEARLAMRSGLAGLALACAGGVWATLDGGPATLELALGDSVSCLVRASLLGLAPAIITCAFLSHTCTRRPYAGAGASVLGAVALGAILVHATCRAEDPLHMLLGHSLAPLWVVLAVTLPLGFAIGRLGRLASPSSPF